ncbi:hypothetical protein [Pacificoceanicola onchidii]|uniref:hypothetical protein n=1 Tax=Pacificoceanicola onchidii TaxID=2562685 RepID=UPI0010A51274|nr:hypothetical protein [Pacificoceanicola onchidii]
MANIVQKTAVIACDHQGQASIQQVSSRVKVDGQFAVIVPNTMSVSGCPLQSGSSPVPCATLQFSQGTVRVKSDQKPLLLDTAKAIANGPLGVQGSASIQGVQSRVSAQ